MTADSIGLLREDACAAVAAARWRALEQGTGIEYYDAYLAAWAHQRHCSPLFLDLASTMQQPSRSCMTAECLTRTYETALARGDTFAHRADFEVCRRYAWAVPCPAALDAIAEASPAGVVEVGAGGGYWAYELGHRGVDVLAYDPHPPGDHPANDRRWHVGYPWADVREGDHTAAAAHPDRTLFVCWPTMDQWAGEAVAHYHAAGGRTVVYIGEGPDGMTGDYGLWRRLGLTDGSEPVDDPAPRSPAQAPPVLYTPVHKVHIPQWAAIHDRLTICRLPEDEPDNDPHPPDDPPPR